MSELGYTPYISIHKDSMILYCSCGLGFKLPKHLITNLNFCPHCGEKYSGFYHIVDRDFEYYNSSREKAIDIILRGVNNGEG